MNVVDSSAWLEYFAGGKNAAFFAQAIESPDKLVVPSITIAEVFKRILQQRGEAAALQAAAHMSQGEIVELDSDLAIAAAKISHDMKMPLADGIILATAREWRGVLWTQDEDFKGLEDVKFFSKR